MLIVTFFPASREIARNNRTGERTFRTPRDSDQNWLYFYRTLFTFSVFLCIYTRIYICIYLKWYSSHVLYTAQVPFSCVRMYNNISLDVNNEDIILNGSWARGHITQDPCTYCTYPFMTMTDCHENTENILYILL